jgi:methylenetetrahydrofolate dehydrogenase (NADP+) / methenyltetrahydrofolate cyclohydrolase
MPALELDGKAVAKLLERELSARVDRLLQGGDHKPILATLLVGNDPASATYVRMKGNACERVGMASRQIVLPEDTTTDQLLCEIDVLNADPRVRGILLQHPVPRQIDERACFDRIAVDKDVDGVTALGYGNLSMGRPAYGSATPAGIMRLLQHYAVDIAGKLAVVVGRSPILGKPMSAMLLNADATVMTCHSKSRDLPILTQRADIVVGAVGRPHFIKGEWLKDGAVAIDAGYHPGGIGDIDLADHRHRLAAYTPVPGGVGPMTIATLIAQTVDSFETHLDRRRATSPVL